MQLKFIAKSATPSLILEKNMIGTWISTLAHLVNHVLLTPLWKSYLDCFVENRLGQVF